MRSKSLCFHQGLQAMHSQVWNPLQWRLLEGLSVKESHYRSWTLGRPKARVRGVRQLQSKIYRDFHSQYLQDPESNAALNFMPLSLHHHTLIPALTQGTVVRLCGGREGWYQNRPVGSQDSSLGERGLRPQGWRKDQSDPSKVAPTRLGRPRAAAQEDAEVVWLGTEAWVLGTDIADMKYIWGEDKGFSLKHYIWSSVRDSGQNCTTTSS